MTRDQLIEEIVQDWKKRRSEEFGNYEDVQEFFLRTALLRISNASMDAMEVEEEKIQHYTQEEVSYCAGHSAAITASKEKRREWCEDIK